MDADEQLVNLISAVADRAYEEYLSDGVQCQKYLHVSGHPEAGLFQRESREDPFAFGVTGNIRITEIEKSVEWGDLTEYLKREYNISTNQSILQGLLLSVFGNHLEYREEYQDQIASKSEDTTTDAKRPAYDFKSFVFGLDLDSSLAINGVQLRPRHRDDVQIDIRRIDQLLPDGSISVPDKSILRTSVIEHSVAGGDDLEDQKRGHTTLALTCGLLNIFVDASYSLVRTELSGRFFRTGSVHQYPETRIGAQSRFEVNPKDQDQLENLHSLLHPHAAEDDERVFDYPLSVAYHSLQRSWEYKNTFREALGWLLIGLEAIVGSNGNVSGRVSLLVSSISDRFDYDRVDDQLGDGFQKRSKWAHGASRKRDDPSPQHMQIRDYLRSSMVAYGYLLANNVVDSRKSLRDKLEESLEDGSPDDDWLREACTDLTLTDYLQLPPEETEDSN